MFADVSYLTYFNSLYVEAVLLIGLMYLFAAAISLQKETKRSNWYLGLIVVDSIVLCMTKNHCYLIGFIVGVFFYLQARLKENKYVKVRYYLITLILCFAGIISLNSVDSDFDEISKLHAMTRGVLLQSDNPVETLQEFNIDGSFSMLTDVSLYDEYPATTIDNEVLQEEFLDKYSTFRITLYYVRHPGAFVSMLDLAIKSSFQLRKSNCGNYERSVGMPEMSQSIFWSAFSTFKIRSAPKTIGYLAVLIFAYVVMSAKNIKAKGKFVRSYYVYLTTMFIITLIGISHAAYIIISTGDAQLGQYGFILGFCMDCLFYFVLAEILHKLNLFEHKGEENGEK